MSDKDWGGSNCQCFVCRSYRLDQQRGSAPVERRQVVPLTEQEWNPRVAATWAVVIVGVLVLMACAIAFIAKALP